ncbi:MAG: hypothetical protein U1F35_14035 [Steroidobacteraceae bacterium]
MRIVLSVWMLGAVILSLAALSYFLFATRRENAFARLLVSLWAALIWPLACFSPDGRRLLREMLRGR